jgi:hypothetical protein
MESCVGTLYIINKEILMSPESRIVGKRNDLLTPTAEAKNILNERT